METETVAVNTLPARTARTEGDIRRAEFDDIVRSLAKLPKGQAIIIRIPGESGKGMSSKLGRAAKRVGMFETTQRGSGEDEKGVYAFIRRID